MFSLRKQKVSVAQTTKQESLVNSCSAGFWLDPDTIASVHKQEELENKTYLQDKEMFVDECLDPLAVRICQVYEGLEA